jgi:IclR family KDG regulon transcriptional repressor
MTSDQKINSIIRATDILTCLSEGIAKLTDISQKLELSKGTTHRFLKTLEIAGFATQDPLTRQYCLGHRILKLALNPMVSHRNLILCSLEDLEHLRDISGETAILHIPNGNKRIVLEEVESHHPIRFFGGKGDSAPIYAGASGKVLLSEFNERDRTIFLKNIPLIPLTPQTITDMALLLEELVEIRKLGYAKSSGEVMNGTAAISVPIKNYACPVALSLVGPEGRFLNKRISFLDDLKKSAKNISNKVKMVSNLIKTN